MSSILSNPFAVEEHVLTTRLSPAQCRARLEGSLFTWESLPEEWSYDNPRLRNPVVGTVGPHGYSIRKWWRYRRPFELEVWGDFQPTQGGTLVRVYKAMRREIAAFFLFWFVFMLAVQVGLWLGILGNSSDSLTQLGSWAPGLAAVVGAVVYLLGRAQAKRDGDFLLGFLREVLQASEGSTHNSHGEYSRP